MADINLTQIRSDNQNAGSVTRPDAGADIRTKDRQDVRERTRQEEEKRKKLEEERLDNVISVSKDGDTVQASEESRAKLEADEDKAKDTGAVSAAASEADEKDEAKGIEEADGKVIVNENTVRDRIEADAEARKRRQEILEDISSSSERAMSVRDLFSVAAENRKTEAMTGQTEKDESKAFDRVKSFVGYSDAQLQQMYRKGEISKQDYDREIDSREEKREKEQEESKKLSRNVTVEASLAEENEREGKGIKVAFSEDSSDTIRPEDRVDMIQKANENFSLG